MINQELFYERAGLLVEEVQGGSMENNKARKFFGEGDGTRLGIPGFIARECYLFFAFVFLRKTNDENIRHMGSAIRGVFSGAAFHLFRRGPA